MFTPQRKSPWTPATSAPRTEPRSTGSRLINNYSAAMKGKAVAFLDGPPQPPPPPVGSLAAEGGGELGFENGRKGEDWRRFKEAGFLDGSSLERKDREALAEKASRLEKELYEYQHSMGLLLIEKDDLASKNEELGQVVAESQEILKREQTAHLIAITEAEKREENLKNALNIERKCVADLERALVEMREELANMKDTSKTTATDINAQMEVLEKKRAELEAKSHSVNAKLAEVDRKTSELDRKLRDLEARENIMKMEHLTFTQERDVHESSFRKQKEDLLEWERKLQEAEQRLCDSRSALHQREEKLHVTEKMSKEKESKLVELQQKIDLANATLKKMEDDINSQSTELSLKEKKAEAMRRDLEMREKKLKEKEEILNAREEVELQKLLSEQKAILDAKMHGFELEMKQKRQSFEEELENKKQAVSHRETEINHLEAKIAKREQALEKKAERVKEKEKDVDIKVKGLKEQEKCLKAEEKRLKVEKEQLKADIEHLEGLKEEIEALKAELKKQELQIEEERRKLGDVEAERSEYLRLQLNLKQEMENVRRQNELIEKEIGDLKLEREKFEKDWEALDEKRAAVDNALKMLTEERGRIEKLQSSEEERLKNQKAEIEEYIRQETESIRLEKESFEANMKHEKLMLSQKAEDERRLMLQDYEQRRENLEIDMQKRQKEWEKLVQAKERDFEEMRSREMKSIIQLKEDVKKRMEEMEAERHLIEKERREVELSKKQLEETGVEISKDIEALDNLSKKLKSQREQLIHERAYFVTFVEKIKSCNSCGDSVQEFLLKDIIQLPTLEGSSDLHKYSPYGEVSKKASNKGSSEFGGQMNILQRCTSVLFRSPPSKGRDLGDDNDKPGTSLLKSVGPSAGPLKSANDEPQTSTIVREDNVDNPTPSVDVSYVNSEAQGGIEESEVSDLKSGRRKPGRKRGAGVHRTRTMKSALKEAEAFLGEASEGKVEQSADEKANNNQDTVHADRLAAVGARKRSRSQASRMTESEQDVEISEGRADSVTTDGRRKRRQTAVTSTLATPGQRRYNLRRHTAAATAPNGPQKSDGKTKDDGGAAHGKNKRRTVNPDEAPTQSLDITVDSERELHAVQEFSSEKITKGNASAKVDDSNVDAAKSAENTMWSEEVKPAEEDPALTEGTSEYVDQDNTIIEEIEEEAEEDGDVGEVDDDDDNDDDDDDDDDDHPGQASVGKVLWKFFTT